jgi:hypothetical protein
LLPSLSLSVMLSVGVAALTAVWPKVSDLLKVTVGR